MISYLVFLVTASLSAQAEPAVVTPPATEPTATTASDQTLPTENEDWYFLFGIGASKVKYGDDDLDTTLNTVENQTGVNRATVNMDLLGFYWPLDGHKSMQGFVINVVSDIVDNKSTNSALTISSVLYAYSFQHFFGKNIGDGFFLRADAGLAKYNIHIDIPGTNESRNSDYGFGILGGGGYSFGIGPGTRMLLGAYATYRKAEGDDSSGINITLGFLF